jgi:hypothetical protein
MITFQLLGDAGASGGPLAVALVRGPRFVDVLAAAVFYLAGTFPLTMAIVSTLELRDQRRALVYRAWRSVYRRRGAMA